MKLNWDWVTGLRLWLPVGYDAALPLNDPGVWDGCGAGLYELLAAVRQSGRTLGPSRIQTWLTDAEAKPNNEIILGDIMSVVSIIVKRFL